MSASTSLLFTNSTVTAPGANSVGPSKAHASPSHVTVRDASEVVMRTSLRELLEAAPDRSITKPIADAVALVRQYLGLPEPDLRIGKLGRKLYIELDFVVGPGTWDLGAADRVRRDLLHRLAQPGRLLWVNVELRTAPDWDR